MAGIEKKKHTRWAATYTKHLTQKRKVYHDGVIAITPAADKVHLYDDDGKLIESKYLKRGDVVKSGRSLTLEAHLVDIGEGLEENVDACEPPEESAKNELKKTQRNFGLTDKLHPFSRTRKEVPEARFKGNVSDTRACNNTTDPCSEPRNLTRKNDERGTLESTSVILKEWSALYTTQLSKKAKSYHDGILQLVQVGSHAKQIILLNEDGTILSSKYLKATDCIESGMKFEFPAYLVEVCEENNRHKDDATNNMKQELTSESSFVEAHPTDRVRKAKRLHLLKDPESKRLTNPSSTKLEKLINADRISSQQDDTPTNATASWRTSCQIMSFLRKPSAELAHDRKLSSAYHVKSSPSSLPIPVDEQGQTKTGFAPSGSDGKSDITTSDNRCSDVQFTSVHSCSITAEGSTTFGDNERDAPIFPHSSPRQLNTCVYANVDPASPSGKCCAADLPGMKNQLPEPPAILISDPGGECGIITGIKEVDGDAGNPNHTSKQPAAGTRDSGEEGSKQMGSVHPSEEMPCNAEIQTSSVEFSYGLEDGPSFDLGIW